MNPTDSLPGDALTTPLYPTSNSIPNSMSNPPFNSSILHLIHNLTQAAYKSDNNSDLNGTLMSTGNGNGDENHYFRNVGLTVAYCLIVFISLVGNCLVVKTVSTVPKMRNPTNILIAVLAFSDLLMTVCNIPFTVYDIITRDWIFGAFFCRLVSFVQANCVYVSSFTMTLIALYRWQSVYNQRGGAAGAAGPEHRMKLYLSIALIWTLAAVHSLPHTIFCEIVEMHKKSGARIYRCYARLPESIPNFRLILTLATFVTQYVIPLSISGLIYTRIGFTIASRGRVGEMSAAREKEIYNRKRKRIVMLMLVVVIFAACWLPLNAYYLLVDFDVIRMNFHIFLPCHWFAMSSVCYNPFVYCWLNDNFRSEAKRYLGFLWRSGSNGGPMARDAESSMTRRTSC